MLHRDHADARERLRRGAQGRVECAWSDRRATELRERGLPGQPQLPGARAREGAYGLCQPTHGQGCAQVRERGLDVATSNDMHMEQGALGAIELLEPAAQLRGCGPSAALEEESL